MSEDNRIELIKKYLEGSCTEEEKKDVELWFELYEGGDKKFHNEDPEVLKEVAKRGLASIQQKIASQEAVIVDLHKKGNLR